LTDGEAIHEEGGEGRCGASAKSAWRRGRPPAANPMGQVHL